MIKGYSGPSDRGGGTSDKKRLGTTVLHHRANLFLREILVQLGGWFTEQAYQAPGFTFKMSLKGRLRRDALVTVLRLNEGPSLGVDVEVNEFLEAPLVGFPVET